MRRIGKQSNAPVILSEQSESKDLGTIGMVKGENIRFLVDMSYELVSVKNNSVPE